MRTFYQKRKILKRRCTMSFKCFENKVHCVFQSTLWVRIAEAIGFYSLPAPFISLPLPILGEALQNSSLPLLLSEPFFSFFTSHSGVSIAKPSEAEAIVVRSFIDLFDFLSLSTKYSRSWQRVSCIFDIWVIRRYKLVHHPINLDKNNVTRKILKAHERSIRISDIRMITSR